MKWLVVFLSGVVLGLIFAVLILGFNPLLGESGKAPGGNKFVFSSDSPGFALSHGEVMPFPVQPANSAPLWESTIKGMVIAFFPLRGEDGEIAALGTRASWLDESTDFLMKGPQSQSAWLLSFPGRGTLAMEQEESLWTIIRHGVVPVWVFGQTYAGSGDYALTHGPSLDGGRILAGTGSLAGAAGSLQQAYQIDRFTKAGLAFESEIGVELNAAETAAETAVEEEAGTGEAS